MLGLTLLTVLSFLSTTTVIKAAPTGAWVSAGCYVDSSNRAIGSYAYTSPSMTVAACQQACQSRNYLYAGIEYGQECYCSNAINVSGTSGTLAASTDCNINCPGTTQACGGSWRLSVFKFVAGSTSTSTSTLKSTTTSKAQSTSTTKTTSLTTTKPTTTASSPVPTSTSVKKAGLGWNSNSGNKWSTFTDIANSKISWTYGWASSPVAGTPLTKVEFVPMAWGLGDATSFAQQVANFPGWGVKNLLSFNEPDQQAGVGGANISPAQAASTHRSIFTPALASKYRIGTPAVARGSKSWLQQWMTACNGQCAYNFIPLHFYGNNAADMISYIKDFIATFNKPVWVTEYACMDYGATVTVCSLAQAEAFQTTVIKYMESEPMVERYAAFGAFTDYAAGGNANGLMDSSGAANALGVLYATT